LSDWIEILDTPLNAADCISRASDVTAGGIDVFLGTTRAEKHPDGRELVALDYEAYDEMAIKQLHDLARQSRERWPIIKLVIVHRKGRVDVGHASVIIAVSCPHRVESFEACRYLIDQLKAVVPIWKKEVWSDESTSWVEPSIGTQG